MEIHFGSRHGVTGVLESRVEGLLGDLARAQGGRAEKWGVQGWPDRVVLLPGGRVGFIELKRPGEEPTVLQLARLEALAALGFVTGWANTFLGVEQFMERLKLTNG